MHNRFFSGIFLLITAASLWACSNNEAEPANPLLFSQNAARCAPAAVNNEFSNPVKVTISGYSGHAMEPFISRVGNYLFFNSLNDGLDTSLYYAERIDDITFVSKGKIAGGVNGIPPHLDAVASMDASGRFHFISTRDYPGDYKNVFSGEFSAGSVSNLHAQTGNFYIESPGWIIMDAEVSPDGSALYFVNAHFSTGTVPDLSDIGVAIRSGDDFNSAANSSEIMQNINTGDCLEYAPAISNNGLELFFTRLDPRSGSSGIYVAKRDATSVPFKAPEIIGALSGFVEAPSITNDGKTLYYHYIDDGTFAIYKISRP
jgi:Tol biopolymer transport system component